MFKDSRWMLVLSAALVFAAGCQGEAGKDGAQGPAGPAGPTGPQGTQGVQGPQGEPGVNGATGATGATGASGATGEQGVPGPITAPPEITDLSPKWGSADSFVTLTGKNFGATAADNKVFFNGFPAAIVSASATQLVVQSGQQVSHEQAAAVSVEVANQVSNAMAFMLVPPGTTMAEDVPLPTNPTGAVEVGTDIYVAGGSAEMPSAGLYQRASSGKVTRLWAAKHVEWFDSYTMSLRRVYDVPVAVATDGTDVYFTSAHGHVRKYVVATGTVVEVMAPQYSRGGGEGRFPPLAGIAVDASKNVLVVDRWADMGEGRVPAVHVIAPDGEVTTHFAFGHEDLWGIAVDGSDVYVTGSEPEIEHVYRLNLADSAPTFSVVGQNVQWPRGIAISGGTLYISQDDGSLVTMKTDGSSFATHAQLTYRADQITVSSSGLLLAQGEGSAVRRLPANGPPELLVVGARPAFGAVEVGGTWYFAAVGPGMMNNGGNGPNMTLSDSSVLAVWPDGSSKTVLSGVFFSGLAADPAGTKLAVSDCFGQRVWEYTLANGTATQLVTAADGLHCPAGLAYSASGDLLYLNADPMSLTPASIGKVSGATKTPEFVTGLPPFAIFLALSGAKAYAGVAPGNPGEIWSADLASGGAATLAVPTTRIGELMALSSNKAGRMFLVRSGNEVAEYVAGEVVPFTYANAGDMRSGYFGILSLGFKADDTLVFLDSSGVWNIAP